MRNMTTKLCINIKKKYKRNKKKSSVYKSGIYSYLLIILHDKIVNNILLFGNLNNKNCTFYYSIRLYFFFKVNL